MNDTTDTLRTIYSLTALFLGLSSWIPLCINGYKVVKHRDIDYRLNTLGFILGLAAFMMGVAYFMGLRNVL